MDSTGLVLNYLLSALSKKIIVPTGFHDQVEAIKNMQANDVSGLVDVLTDYAVNSAAVEYSIETDNDTLNETFRKWFNIVNIEYLGKINPGINSLAEEYYKERWKYSSFPVLRLGKWEKVGELILPMRLFFLDGGSIYAKDKDEEGKNLNLLGYDYYITDDLKAENLLNKNIIFSNPYGRVHDKYPTPYLIKRGTYFNYKVIDSLKNKQNEILEQVIPYLFLVKKGTEALALNKIKTYGQEELKQVLTDFQSLMNKYKEIKEGDKSVKSNVRVTNFDEELKHLIPDLSTIFKRELFSTAEKSILAGLGFIDIAEAVTDSRRESILNPKVFIEETKKGVKDFKKILQTLMILVWQRNKDNVKFKNVNYRIASSPITGFINNNFKQELRLLWKHGQLSNKTYCELVGEVDFEIEKKRRKKEAEDGTEIVMYPHITDNREADVSAEEIKHQELLPKDEDKNGKPIPEDKLDEDIKEDKYTFSSTDLKTAPYQKVTDLSPKIRKVLSPDLQSTFIRVFNSAYDTYGNETSAFRVTWSLIRQIARKNKKGIWIRKRKKKEGKLEAITLNKSMVEKTIEEENNLIIEEENKVISDNLKRKKLEIANKQNQLLDKLLGKGKEKKE